MGIIDIIGSPRTRTNEAEALTGLERICQGLRKDLWQTLNVVQEEPGFFALKTDTEIIARVKFEMKYGYCVKAFFRTDLLAKYRENFRWQLPGVEIFFDRLRPYLERI